MLRILITAGPTREYIDPVRFLSNDSSGRMGFAIAAAAVAAEHAVTLVHGPVALTPPAGTRAIAVTSALDMQRECALVWPDHDVLIMTAAVADYRPEQQADKKHKRSGDAWSLPLVPNPDIVAGLSQIKRADQAIIGFALEDSDQHANAEKKLREKGLAAIVLNHPTAIGSDENEIEICTGPGRWSERQRGAKEMLGTRIVAIAAELHRAAVAATSA